MPWTIALSISIFLFLLAPFFRKWVDIVLWPILADWWATRSRGKTKKRIEKLEQRLRYLETIPPSTEFETTVLLALSGILKLITVVACIAALLAILALDVEHKLFAIRAPYKLELVAFVLLTFLLGSILEGRVSKFGIERYPAHREAIRKQIEKLRVALPDIKQP
jgi:hypothetical protein